MRRHAVPASPSIASRRAHPINFRDSARRDGHVVAAGDPELGAGMAKSPRGWGQLGNNVVRVGDAPQAALVCHVLGQCGVTHAWLAIGIQIQRISSIAQGSASQSSNSTTQAVARQDQPVAGVRRRSTCNPWGQIISDSFPGLEESRVRRAARTEAAGIGLAEVQVGNPIADGMAASEGQHDQLIGIVYGEETCNIAKFGGVIEFVQGRRSRGLDFWTVASRAGHSIARGVEVV